MVHLDLGILKFSQVLFFFFNCQIVSVQIRGARMTHGEQIRTGAIA